MRQLTPGSAAERLLTPADLVPLDPNRLEDAQAMIPLNLEAEAVQISQQQALGLFLQKGVRALLFNPAHDSGDINPAIEEYYSRVAQEVQESDLLERLVADLSMAQTMIGQSGAGQGGMLGRLKDLAHKRQRQRAEVAEANAYRLQREAELAELRNLTFEAEKPAINIGNLKIGDKARFSLVSTEDGQIPQVSEVVMSELSAVVIGHEQDDSGQPILLLEVKYENRIPEHKFIDTAKTPGIVIRLLGTIMEEDSKRYPRGKITQGEILQLRSSEGHSLCHATITRGMYKQAAIHARLAQLYINEVGIFPPTKWEYVYTSKEGQGQARISRARLSGQS